VPAPAVHLSLTKLSWRYVVHRSAPRQHRPSDLQECALQACLCNHLLPDLTRLCCFSRYPSCCNLLCSSSLFHLCQPFPAHRTYQMQLPPLQARTSRLRATPSDNASVPSEPPQGFCLIRAQAPRHFLPRTKQNKPSEICLLSGQTFSVSVLSFTHEKD